MYFIVTNGVSPYAAGKWTDIPGVTKNMFGPSGSLSQGDPLQQQIDQWGKLDSEFNNIESMPISQEINGDDWPYLRQKEKHLLDESDKNDLELLSQNDTTPTITEPIKELKKNTEFVQKIRKLYKKKMETVETPFESYRKNLTSGIVAQEAFQIPEEKLVNRN